MAPFVAGWDRVRGRCKFPAEGWRGTCLELPDRADTPILWPIQDLGVGMLAADVVFAGPVMFDDQECGMNRSGFLGGSKKPRAIQSWPDFCEKYAILLAWVPATIALFAVAVL